MEDHSLRGYLKRRSTKELEAILAYCLQDKIYEKYSREILEMLAVLNERFVPDVTSEQYIRAKELLLQREKMTGTQHRHRGRPALYIC